MSDEKIILARLKKGGCNFEISIDADLALEFKEGKIDNVSEVLKSDRIFSDVKKGRVVSNEELEKVFETTDVSIIASIIIRKGEIQLSSEHRTKEREQRKRQLIDMIHRLTINPNGGIPHPINRIEAALDDAKISLSDHKTVEEQFDGIISRLRPIIPLKIEQRVLLVQIQSSDVGKTNGFIRNNSKVLKEDWDSEGSWRIKIEIPAGIQQDVIDKLNSLTHGKVIINIENE